MGSLVGSTEHNIRKALQIADAMAPCVCLIDEVEKALSGVASSGQTDSGVSARLFGTLLTWMNDRTASRTGDFVVNVWRVFLDVMFIPGILNLGSPSRAGCSFSPDKVSGKDT